MISITIQTMTPRLQCGSTKSTVTNPCRRSTRDQHHHPNHDTEAPVRKHEIHSLKAVDPRVISITIQTMTPRLQCGSTKSTVTKPCRRSTRDQHHRPNHDTEAPMRKHENPQLQSRVVDPRVISITIQTMTLRLQRGSKKSTLTKPCRRSTRDQHHHPNHDTEAPMRKHEIHTYKTVSSIHLLSAPPSKP